MEIVAVMVLLSAFLFLAGRVFSNTHRLTRETHAVETTARQVDYLVRQLRQDAWAAQTVESSGRDSIRLELTGAKTVIWRIEGEGGSTRMIRQQGLQERRFALPVVAGIAPAESGVRVRLGQESALLPSQVLMLEVRP